MSKSASSARAASSTSDGEEVHPEAHIAGLDDGRMARRGALILRFILGGKPGRADDVDDARLRGELGKGDGRRRRGEVEDAIDAGEGGSGSSPIGTPFGPRPASSPASLADLGGAGPLDRAGEPDARRFGDDADQRPPHAAGGADDDKAHVGHGISMAAAL